MLLLDAADSPSVLTDGALTDRVPQTLAADGTHLLAEWYGCDFSLASQNDSVSLRAVCLAATRESGLQVVGEIFHQFQPQGVTGTVLLAESHLAIHTWPQEGFVTLDVYVCNYQADNTHKALQLYTALKAHFSPWRETLLRVRRGPNRE